MRAYKNSQERERSKITGHSFIYITSTTTTVEKDEN